MALLLEKNIGRGVICSYYKIGGIVADNYNKTLTAKIHGYVDETYRNSEKLASENEEIAKILLGEINELSAQFKLENTDELQLQMTEKTNIYNELMLSDDRAVNNTVYTADYDLSYSENVSISDVYEQIKLLPDFIGAMDI